MNRSNRGSPNLQLACRRESRQGSKDLKGSRELVVLRHYQLGNIAELVGLLHASITEKILGGRG